MGGQCHAGEAPLRRLDSAATGNIQAVAARHDATPAQIALAWVMAQPAIASATSVAQLRELMGALRVELSAGDLAELDRASA